MRLDQFLKISRLVSRRTLAQEFCDAGLISVNGAKAKSSKDVMAGDEIEITRRDRRTRILVTTVPTTKQIAKNAAADLYEVLEESRTEEDPDLI